MVKSISKLFIKSPKQNLVAIIGHGGDRIKRKLFLSVLLLFSLALFLNMNFSSATTVNQTDNY